MHVYMYTYIKALIIFNTRLFSSYHVLLLLLLLLYNPINMSKKAHSNHLDLNTSLRLLNQITPATLRRSALAAGPEPSPVPAAAGSAAVAL